MRYNILINSKNNVGGDNPSNYKYNFNFSNFQEGDYELGFNFNTKGLKEVQATPIQISNTTEQTFVNNPVLNITDVSNNYQYALSNGTPYTVVSSGDVNGSNVNYMAFERSTRRWGSLENSYDIITGLHIRNNTINVNNILISGQSLGINLPYKLKLTSFILQAYITNVNTRVKDYVLIGSNDGDTIWNSILEGTAEDTIDEQLILTTNNQNFYNRYRIIVKNTYIQPITSNPSIVLIQSFFLFGETYPVNNASPLQIELKGLGATQKAYTTTDLTAAKNSNVIGTIPLSKLSYYNTSYKFNNLITISSKPLSNEITINLKNGNGELFNIDEDYLMVLSFLKK